MHRMRLKAIKEEKASRGTWAQGRNLPNSPYSCSDMLHIWGQSSPPLRQLSCDP